MTLYVDEVSSPPHATSIKTSCFISSGLPASVMKYRRRHPMHFYCLRYKNAIQIVNEVRLTFLKRQGSFSLGRRKLSHS